MITKPFNLESRLKRPSAAFEFVPFIDACVIGLFFVLLSSRFVLATGFSLDLPTVEDLPRDAAATSRVLTLSESQGTAMLIFEGRVCTLESFARVTSDRSSEFESEILLLRADRDVSLELLAQVWEMCIKAGFKRVLISAEPEAVSESAIQ